MFMTIKATLGHHSYKLKKVYGREFEYEFITCPCLKNEVLFLPLKEIIEGFGGEVCWDGSTLTATSTIGNTTSSIKIDTDYEAYISEKGSIMVSSTYYNKCHDVRISYNSETGDIELERDAITIEGGRIPDAKPPQIIIDPSKITLRFFISSDSQGTDLG